jgi:hypothetical protein
MSSGFTVGLRRARGECCAYALVAAMAFLPMLAVRNAFAADPLNDRPSGEPALGDGDVNYFVHAHDAGNLQGWSHNGALRGSLGAKIALENLTIHINGNAAALSYQGYQGNGEKWQNGWTPNNQESGPTHNKTHNLEGIRFGENHPGLFMRVHVSFEGWHEVKEVTEKNIFGNEGLEQGKESNGRGIEAIQLCFAKNDNDAKAIFQSEELRWAKDAGHDPIWLRGKRNLDDDKTLLDEVKDALRNAGH